MKYVVDMTPYYTLVASTSEKDAYENEKPLKDKTKLDASDVPVTVSTPIPASLAADNEQLWVSHTHDGKRSVRHLTVKDGKLTFVSRNGFSEFVITKDKPDLKEIAEVDGAIYESLQGAVDAVEDGKTIILKSKGDIEAIADYTKTFTVDITGVEGLKAEDLEITAGTNYDIVLTGNGDGAITYTVSRNSTIEPLPTAVPIIRPHTAQAAAAAPTAHRSRMRARDCRLRMLIPKIGSITAVKTAYENKLMNGISDTVFAPDLTLTRGMFATILGRMDGVPVCRVDS